MATIATIVIVILLLIITSTYKGPRWPTDNHSGRLA